MLCRLDKHCIGSNPRSKCRLELKAVLDSSSSSPLPQERAGAHGLAAAGVTLRFFAAAGVRSPSLSLSSTNTSPSSAPSEVSCTEAKE